MKQWQISKRIRFGILILLVFICFAALIYRILSLSYFDRASYLKTLNKTRTIFKKYSAKRGNILDRNGEILATSATQLILGIDPYSVNFDKDQQKIKILSDLLGIPIDVIKEKCTKKKIISNGKLHKERWIELCKIEEHELLKAIEQLHISGIYGIEKEHRIYPLGEACAHITGFINHDGIPVCGVEKHMDFYLSGQDGFINSEKDGRRRELVQYRTQNISKNNGCDVVLTIDSKIQQMVYRQLQNLADQYSPECASIIVSDAITGEIFALGNHPSYDPNNYGKFPIENMRNRAVSDVYEPGSTFKIVVSSLALEYGLVDDDTTFDCSQETVTNRGATIAMPKDHRLFGNISYVDVIRCSSNRGMALMGLMLGEKKVYNGIKNFGYGSKTGYGFDSEVSGLLYPPSRWDAMTITRLPSGYCIAVTPIQTNYAMSVISSNGLLLSPQLFKSINNNGNPILKFHSQIRHRVLSKETASHIRDILNNPSYGKMHRPITYCGKSGTAQKIIDGKYSHDHHISSFVGFFPAECPRVTITVVVNDAKVNSGVAWGSRIALPIFKSLAEEISEYLNL